MMYCLKNSTKPVGINAHVEGRELRSLELVDDQWKFTEQGLELFNEIEIFFNKENVEISKKIISNDYEKCIKKYLDLFPRKKLPTGLLARSNKKNIESNFKWFFKTFDYDWDTILKATAHYVDEYEKNNYMYMQTSQYFICKTQPDKTKLSTLADYCELIVSGGELDEDEHFKEKVV